MKITDFFRRKSATTQSMTVQQLLDFLGLAETDSSVLSEATYYACIKVLMEAIGKLPLKLQIATDSQGIRVAREHRYYRMLNERPNKYMSATVFWSTMEMHRNHFGNAYAYIDTQTDPKKPQLWPLDPGCMKVVYDNAGRFGDPNVYYYYSTAKGARVFMSEELLHFKAHHTEAGLVGIPVKDQLSATIQGNNKAQALVNKLYDNGMTGKTVLQYTGNIKDASVDAMAKGIQEYIDGKKKGKGVETVVPLPLGLTLTPLNLKLTDSQFLELKQLSALQIASAFGVRPYQIGDYTKSSYASAEAQQLSFLIDTLLFIIKSYEEEIGFKLLTDEEEAAGLHAKFNTAVLLRADQRTQMETLSTAVNSFLLTPNEAREMIDKPAKPGGDALLGNGASIPVEYAGSQYTNTAREEDKAWLKEIITEALNSRA